MVQAQATDLLDSLIDDLREYISESQRPKPSDPTWMERAQHAGESFYASLASVKEAVSIRQTAYAASLSRLGEELRSYIDALQQSLSIDALKAQCNDLARSYEELLLALKASRVARAEQLNRSRQLKPTNYTRNLFHAAMGLLAVGLYQFVLTQAQALWVLGSVFAFFGILEVSRRFSPRWNDFLVDTVFGMISRPSERYRVNSSTLYVLALILITALFPKLAAEAGILILGIGDPVASLIGKRFGKKKLFRDKSYAGSIAFWVAGFISTFLLFALVGLPLGKALGVASVVALFGAVAELLSSRIDDNFSVPLVCAMAATLFL